MRPSILIRALIFALYPPGFDRDTADSLLYGFLERLDEVGPNYDTQLMALEELSKARSPYGITGG